ncbi:hypothetical protein Pan44_20660 [Caulifigura coniformis]|uniref:Transmembrane protein n=1 Tax=Caulifigura coniformis TaxID=2527983 RepID=A0A517SD36_9PLAN|nr:hypothetical protein [Caulifigura coniformis]QDT54039.1 hypothetical protein Pan44_20660 [Caulifigura coniformis]
MTASSPRPPLINRPLVGVLAIAGLVGGLGLMAFDRFDNLWGASLFRVGILMSALWLWLAARKEPVAKPSPIATWVTLGIGGFALAAIRSRKPVLMMVTGIVFALVAFIVKPRRPRV